MGVKMNNNNTNVLSLLASEMKSADQTYQLLSCFIPKPLRYSLLKFNTFQQKCSKVLKFLAV